MPCHSLIDVWPGHVVASGHSSDTAHHHEDACSCPLGQWSLPWGLQVMKRNPQFETKMFEDQGFKTNQTYKDTNT